MSEGTGRLPEGGNELQKQGAEPVPAKGKTRWKLYAGLGAVVLVVGYFVLGGMLGTKWADYVAADEHGGYDNYVGPVLPLRPGEDLLPGGRQRARRGKEDQQDRGANRHPGFSALDAATLGFRGGDGGKDCPGAPHLAGETDG